MWDSKTIANAILKSEADEKLQGNQIRLKLFDVDLQIGVGS